MLQITRRGDYAIRGMICLAGVPKDKLVLLSDIASEIGVSQTFLAKIFQDFNKVGLVKSYRGTGGGFMLGRPIEKITLLDIIEAVEGPIAVSRCILADGSCDRESTCPVNPIWKKMRTQMRRMLSSVTLSQLAK
jgi:Rrf2 family protein